MSATAELEALEQILMRERKARKEAERILEEKAEELKKTNQELLALNRNLEETVRQRTQEIESVVRLTQDNPDPLLRLSYNGDIISQNRSAEALLHSFVYRERAYSPEKFWKNLVGEIDFSAPRWNFETLCNDRLFSFTCALHTAEGYINVYGCDITERRRTQQALEESELKWRFAQKAAGDGIWEYNLVTREITFSQNYKELLGFEKGAFLNQERLWRSRIHPNDLHLIDGIIDDYRAGKIKQHSTQYRIRKRSGNYIWILDRGILLAQTNDDKPLKIIGVHTNINQQKELELTSKTTANRLSTLIFNLHMGIIMEDENSSVLVTNKKMCDIFEIDYDAQKRQRDNMHALASRKQGMFIEQERFTQSLQEIVREQRPVLGERWETADGRFINRSFIPVYSNEGVYENISNEVDIIIF